MRKWGRHGRSLTLAVGCALALAGRSDAGGAADDEAARRHAAGVKAAASGQADAARHDLLGALSLAPNRLDAWGDLAKLDDKDPEALALFCVDASMACADVAGTRFRPSKAWPKVADEDVSAAVKLAVARVAAVKAVQAAAGKLRGPEDAATLLHLEGMAAALDDGAPGLAAGREDAFARARTKIVPEKKSVIAALDKVMTAALTKGDLATALAAARIVRGMSQQDGQTKTSPAPPTDALRRALDVIAKVREQLKAKEAPPPAPATEPGAEPPAAPPADAPKVPLRKVWTLEELGLIEDEDVPAWNEAHKTWADPGIAMSPTGLYRVETTCGLKTLEAIALIVEQQHERLVKWYGNDPTKGRTGLVRLCPDDADFEGEGAPFWWAGGFQSGDVTTMIARFPSQWDLGSTLVHELTHRFDVSAFANLPSWVMEGRATFTETGSLTPDTPTVDERFTRWGNLWETANKGYGEKEKLEKLLRGTTEDYRDNYPAGYALWLFLVRFQGFDKAQEGPRPYASRVAPYLESFRKTPKMEPAARFTQHFCDGQEGRASSLEAFCEQFGRYCAQGGSGAQPQAPWKLMWNSRAEDAWKEARVAGSPPRIYDTPTWTSLRSRHDIPDAGEGQAYAAAQLLAAQGMKRESLDAFRWALLADEPDAARFARAAEAEEAGGDSSAAWFDRAVAHRMSPQRFAAPKGAPGGPAQAAWQSARDLAEATGQQSIAAKTSGRLRLSRALRAEQERVAEWTAIPVPDEVTAKPDGAPAPGAPKGDGPAKQAAPRVPELLPARSVLAGGVVEERWAPGDSRPGPWHLSAPDAIELGRDKEGAASSEAVRDAQDRHIFVRSRDWYSGTYTVHTRVRFLSAYARASIVLGQTHRDRGVEVSLEGGDWSYAVGNRDDSTPLRQLYVQLDESRPWASTMTPLATPITFEQPKQIFDVTVVVAGPYMRVLVNGKETISHRAASGMPVEGHVGFSLTTGIVRFEEPEVRRHRVTGPDRASPEEVFDAPVSVKRDTSFPWSTVAGRRVEGLPLLPGGTLLLWYPAATIPEEYESDRARDIAEFMRMSLRNMKVPIVAAVHTGSMDAAAQISANAAAIGLRPPVLAHAGCDAAEKAYAAYSDPNAVGWVPSSLPTPPLWIAVDAGGVIRCAGPSMSVQNALDMFRVLAGR